MFHALFCVASISVSRLSRWTPQPPQPSRNFSPLNFPEILGFIIVPLLSNCSETPSEYEFQIESNVLAAKILTHHAVRLSALHRQTVKFDHCVVDEMGILLFWDICDAGSS